MELMCGWSVDGNWVMPITSVPFAQAGEASSAASSSGAQTRAGIVFRTDFRIDGTRMRAVSDVMYSGRPGHRAGTIHRARIRDADAAEPVVIAELHSSACCKNVDT